MAKRKRVVILGAAGRDFHNFNTVYRNAPEVEVVAFTAAQIPGIEGRTYPPSLAGPLYPKGIPIADEAALEEIIENEAVDLAVMSYSDLAYAKVMHLGARVNAAGADFLMLGTKETFLVPKKPLIAVTAVRTGCGKSQITRFIAERLRDAGKKVVVMRHPMPYGDLEKQAVERMATIEDIDRFHCTIEEREEYEQHVNAGTVIYAGVDYQAILARAEAEADVLLWDGGNNDLPFCRPDLWITLADPLRPGHEAAYYPGETNVRACDIVVLAKTNVASLVATQAVEASVRRLNPGARILRAVSMLSVDRPGLIRGKRVLAVGDGPTLTHGEMKFGAATQAAKEFGARELVDPRPWAVGGLKATFEAYPDIGPQLPAMGYSEAQVADLEKTINAVDCDSVVIGTPFDIQRIVKIQRPCAVVTYRHQDLPGEPGIADAIADFLAERCDEV